MERGLAETRSRAQALLMSGQVVLRGIDSPKPGMRVDEDIELTVKAAMPWVSRGGLKLDSAIREFGLAGSLKGCWLDTGSSTGGFTQVLLSHGAERVYAVDVGYGQLDIRLRSDPRVIVRERVNARLLSREDVPEDLDGATLDLSFISSRLVLPVLASFLKPHAPVILLFKPQFEGAPRDVGKGGIVRDDAVRERILSDWEIWAATAGWKVLARMISPIRGQEGNIEYLLKLENHHA